MHTNMVRPEVIVDLARQVGFSRVDAIINAGDSTNLGHDYEWNWYCKWCSSLIAIGLPHPLWIPGNHDFNARNFGPIAGMVSHDYGIRATFDGPQVVGSWLSPCDSRLMLGRWTHMTLEQTKCNNEIEDAGLLWPDILVSHCPPAGPLANLPDGKSLGIECGRNKPMTGAALVVSGHIHERSGDIEIIEHQVRVNVSCTIMAIQMVRKASESTRDSSISAFEVSKIWDANGKRLGFP
jgi:Icc-related predicted phosphoesterase